MDADSGQGLLDRLKGLTDLIRGAAGIGQPRFSPSLSDQDAERLRRQIDDCLQGRGGEVTARARAAALARSYLELNGEGRRKVLQILADEFGPDPARVDEAALALGRTADRASRIRAEAELREALASPRQKLLAQFNVLPDGVKFLVDMRAELLDAAKDDPGLKALERDLKDLLAGWFDVGFLALERITWRSPALVLEKIMAYEAVHDFRSWDDLKNRLDSDRRLYAFFHPRMPDEPLIFIEAALVKGIAGDVTRLLDEQAPLEDPGKADTAIFYSINNAQKGLAGVSFGNFLIKRVVDSLSAEFPNLRTFATLSPIPGFRTWLKAALARDEAALLFPNEARGLVQAARLLGVEASLDAILAAPWPDRPEAAAELKAPLLRLVARYLMDRRADGRALDPVAHFHLSNGARIERLNWLADRSAKGLGQSLGVMVNYLYRLPDIEANHEAYRGKGRIAASKAVSALAAEG